MKPMHFLILAILLVFSMAACVRSIVPESSQPPTTEPPAEAQPPGESSSITVITPEMTAEQPPVSEVVTGTLQAPGEISVLCAYPPEWVPYTVQEGDTLEGLAALTGIEPGEISTSNCLYAAGVPQVGSIIYLPPASQAAAGGEPAAPAESTAGTTDTQAAATDTQAATTDSQAATTDAQATSDGSSEPSSKKADCKSPYKVRSNEWVWKIGRRCNISPYAIIAYNGLRAPYWLRPGQVLYFPPNPPPFQGK